MTGIFDKYMEPEGANIYNNVSMLDDNYIPSDIGDIKHREEEIDLLSSFLSPCLHNKIPRWIFVQGSIGRGKTVLNRLVLKELETAVFTKTPYSTHSIYIKCVADLNMYHLYKEININMPNLEDFPELNVNNRSLGKQKEIFKFLFENYEGIIIIVLDEIEKLREVNTILKYLHEFHGRQNLRKPCIIGITNKTNFIDKIEKEVGSRLKYNDIYIKDYTEKQIYDIISYKCSLAFKEGVIGNSEINLIAKELHSAGGDIRTGQRILLRAAEYSEKTGKITGVQVKAACKLEIAHKNAETILNEQFDIQLALFCICQLTNIRDITKKPISITDLEREYVSCFDSIKQYYKGKRMVGTSRKHIYSIVKMLEAMGLVKLGKIGNKALTVRLSESGDLDNYLDLFNSTDIFKNY